MLEAWMSVRLARRRAIAASAILLALAASLACGDRPLRGADASAASELTASGDHFLLASSYRMKYAVEARGGAGVLSGEVVQASGTTVYARAAITVDDAVEREAFYRPPDLYIYEPPGGWTVISPWNMGMKADEAFDLPLGEPIVDYHQFVRDVESVRREEGEDIDGPTARYAGTIDLANLPLIGGAGASGVVDADVWIRPESQLPVRIDISEGGDSGSKVTINYYAFDELFAAPDPPAGARPLRDLQLPEAECTGDAFTGCLAAQTDIAPTGTCEGAGRRVCLLPLGHVSPSLIQHLVTHYAQQYGLDVIVMPPAAIPLEVTDSRRNQIDASLMLPYMADLAPVAYADPDAVLIGISAVDLFDSDSLYRYVFGVKRTPMSPQGLISSFRMDPRTYGEPADEALFFSRARKLVSKYIGLLYYGLPESEDPASPMFRFPSGLDALDGMGERLPVQ
jgi:predicted Zn-dependent protease